MLIEVLKTNFEHTDDRGTLTQLVRRGYSQFNVITSKGMAFRGGHYHKLNTEAFYIIRGSCKVTAKKDGDEESFEFKTGDFFRVMPYVFHAFYYNEDTVLVSMYSLGVELEDGSMDSFTE